MSMYSLPMDTNIPVGRLVGNYVDAMLANPEAFRGQQLRGGGPVAVFENLLAKHCGFPYCIATCNATTVLIALAVALKVRGQIVFFPRDHWEGSVAAFRLMGARIKRYDPEKVLHCRAYNVKPAAVIVGSNHQRIDHSPPTVLIEDSCRLPGFSSQTGIHSFAEVQVLSFGPGKPLWLGEGGSALFHNKKLYRKVVSICQHPERAVAEFSTPGSAPKIALNARIHPVAAFLGCMLLNRTDYRQTPN